MNWFSIILGRHKRETLSVTRPRIYYEVSLDQLIHLRFIDIGIIGAFVALTFIK